MPYELVRFPDGYKVMTSTTGKFHSIDALPLERAKAQMRALWASMRGGALTHREKVLNRYGLKGTHNLTELSEATGVARSILQEVYNRGIGAYKTNPTSVRMKGSFKKGVNAPMSLKLSKEQWAMARVYSFLDNNPKHDNDLRKTRGGSLGEDLIGGRLHLRDGSLFWCN